MLSRDPIRFVSESVSADIGQIWNHSQLERCSILTALDPQMKNIETISNLSMPEMVLSRIACERLRWPGARWPGGATTTAGISFPNILRRVNLAPAHMFIYVY